jgi:hypothetical protein
MYINNIYDIESTIETIFTNVVSNKNTDFQFSIFLGLNFITLYYLYSQLYFKEMKNILGCEMKKRYLWLTRKRRKTFFLNNLFV